MRLVVCVKPIPSAAAAERFLAATGRCDRSGPMEINPPDLCAVEEALRVRDLAGGDVVTISMTPDSGFKSLRIPLAMGVDQAIAVSDPALENADLLVTARVLASAISLQSPSLIFFGAEAEDGGGAMLWASVAELLRLPVVSSVHEVAITRDAVRVKCNRSGFVDTVEVALPCVLSISSSANDPRYPTLKGIMAAQRKSIATLSVADLRLAAEGESGLISRTSVLQVAAAPPRRRHGQVITDDRDGARWLAGFIADRLPL